ncbi:protein PHLOEM PROTEIN 2-LIKE A9-like [Zingiber officinale]|uniref:protein PHLOEM PROTEIN 2-LIKE A9-like n=1 Tax=Zingiber officinale TaxID=94328 RepID=UPI001C4C25C1|nr:protein PHLOEM PROTEIN 2-LIKE A9-like [Zingiber officinale]
MTSHYKPSDTLIGELTKQVGDNKITIKPKALAVTWGKDSRYWDINDKEKEGSITLNQVSWLEVTGSFSIKDLTCGKYNLKFKVALKPNAFGWQGSPVYFFVINPMSGKRIWKKRDLSTLKKDGKEAYVPDDLNFEFTADPKPQVSQINFGLYEIWKGGWKGGLEIQEVVIEKIKA